MHRLGPVASTQLSNLLHVAAEPLTWGMAGPWLVNEILFPIGCSLVLFLVEMLVNKWEQPISEQDLG